MMLLAEFQKHYGHLEGQVEFLPLGGDWRGLRYHASGFVADLAVLTGLLLLGLLL